MQAALPYAPYDSAEPIALEVSVADRNAVWSLWQTPRDESQKKQKRHLRFWRKVLP